MSETFFKEYYSQLSKVIVETKATGKTGSAIELEAALFLVRDKILAVKEKNKKVLFVGNGGSAAIASHQALDLWRSTGVKATAFNDLVSLTCIGNDFGYENVFAKPIEMFAESGDLLVAVSSSGKSKNIHQAIDMARKKSCEVIGFSGFEPTNPLRGMGDINFFVNSQAYGLVEVAHLSLIHSIADSVAIVTKGRLI